MKKIAVVLEIRLYNFLCKFLCYLVVNSYWKKPKDEVGVEIDKYAKEMRTKMKTTQTVRLQPTMSQLPVVVPPIDSKLITSSNT